MAVYETALRRRESVAEGTSGVQARATTRIRDTAFKRVLKSAVLGAPIGIDGPNGVMMLHEDAARPAVFLAGGIGVTPFLSMARHAAKEHLPHRITLFYSNRRPEDAAFLDELRALEQSNRNYRLIATMADRRSHRSRGTERRVSSGGTCSSVTSPISKVRFVTPPDHRR